MNIAKALEEFLLRKPVAILMDMINLSLTFGIIILYILKT